MEMTTYHHSILFLLLLLPYAAAQSDSNPASTQYPYKKLSSSMTVILAIFFVIFFLIALMSIYIRQCADSSEEWSSNSTRRHRSSTSRFWKRNHAGLDTSLVQSFPTFSFSEIKDRKIGNPPLECAVCLNELDDGKILRLLPNCGHVFHRDCIDNWIVSHNTCPVCRTDLSKKQTGERLVIVETRSTDHVVGEIENQISITITNVVQDNTFLSSENLKPEKVKLRRSRSAGQLSCVFSSDDEGRSENGRLRRTGSAAENGRSTVCDCTLAVKMDGDVRPLTVPV